MVIVDYSLEASEYGRTISESNLVISSATHVDELKVSLHASSKIMHLKYLQIWYWTSHEIAKKSRIKIGYYEIPTNMSCNNFFFQLA